MSRSNSKQPSLSMEQFYSLIREGQSLAGSRNMQEYVDNHPGDYDIKIVTKMTAIRKFYATNRHAPRCVNKVNNTGMSDEDKKTEIQNYLFIRDMRTEDTYAAFHSSVYGNFIVD